MKTSNTTVRSPSSRDVEDDDSPFLARSSRVGLGVLVGPIGLVRPPPRATAGDPTGFDSHRKLQGNPSRTLSGSPHREEDITEKRGSASQRRFAEPFFIFVGGFPW
jgi:hypothetical protein